MASQFVRMKDWESYPGEHSMGKYIRVFGREGRRWVGVGVDVGNMTIYESGGFASIYLAKVVQKNALI